MKILLLTRGVGPGSRARSYFRRSYGGVEISPETATSFGWFWEKALKQLGHEVRPFIFYRNEELDGGRLSRYWKKAKRKTPLGNLIQGRINRSLLEEARKYRPDLLLVDAGEPIFPETLQQLRRQLRPIMALWLLDHPVSQGWANIVKSMPLYDLVCSFDPEYIPDFKAMGAPRAEYLPCACDADIHRTYELTEEEKAELRADLCFLGAITEARRDFLLQLAEYDLAVWGWNFENVFSGSEMSGKYRGIAFGEAAARVYNASGIVVNVHHLQSRAGLNMRTFEAAGCGAFQLVDHRSELDKHFIVGTEIISYRDMKELHHLIKYYLRRPEERRRIAGRAQARAHGSHTYVHRMTALLDWLSDI